ncbi:hypothetical protein GCM10008094_19510 [Aidingimonas halophila]|nr:hypothetical protein GCM10008094_19510 [Aidingimonas halophila]
MFGSLSVLLMVIVAGFLFTLSGDLTIVMLMFCFFMTFIAVCLLPEPAHYNSALTKVQKHLVCNGCASVSAPRVLMIMLASSLCLGAHGIIYVLGSLHWVRLGYSPVEISSLWAAALLSEIVIFFLADKRYLIGLSPVCCILSGALLGIIRWSGLAIVESYEGILILQSLQGGTLALVVISIMRYSQSHIPENFRSRYFGRLAAISHGTIPLIVTVISGALYEGISGLAMAMGAILCGASVIICIREIYMSRSHDIGSLRTN